MTLKTAARRSRHLQMGVPAAVLGALAASFTAAPAHAASPQDSTPLERLRVAPTRVLPAQAAPSNYVVAPGDTISSIAGRFGLRTTDVLAWNNLSWRSVIYPGQTLKLQSSPAPAPATPTAAPAPAAAAADASHVVVAGDTVFAIAKKYGTTTQTLFALNGLGPSSIIYPGQKLTVRAAAPAAAPAPTAASGGGQRTAALTPEQAANAALIIRIGRELGVSDRGIAIALATGMVESDLRNLDWGDRDSLGIFQQRPSTGWGAPAQIMDADRSTRVFYGGAKDPNGTVTRGLLDIPGWEKMAFTDAAQAVQISAYPHKYGQWETQAFAWLALYG